MSFEQLALLLMLVAIPLLDRLIRAMRARTNESTQAGAPTAAEPAVSPAPPPLPARDARGTAPVPVLVALPVPPRPVPPRPVPALRPRPVAPPAARRATAQRRPAVREPRGMDLRVAIRSMAILGPCRAIEPRDATQIW